MRRRLVLASLREQRARAPVAPRGFLPLRIRHRVDGGEHVVPRERAQRGAHAPGLRVGRQRHVARLAEPVVGRRIELARRVERKPRIAVAAIRVRQPVAHLDPRRPRGAGVAARGALEREEREFAATARAPCKGTLVQRAQRIAAHFAELALGDAILAGQVGAERLRHAQVARLARHPEARAAIGGRDVAAADQRGERRVAGVGRGLVGEPEGLGRRERVVAVALPPVQNPVAREFDVVVRRGRVVDREPVPDAFPAQKLQPVGAQAIGERRIGVAVEIAGNRGRRRVLEPQLQLPVADVRRQHVAGELRRDRRELRAVALVEGGLGGEEVGVGLGVRRQEGPRERQKAERERAATGYWRGHRFDSRRVGRCNTSGRLRNLPLVSFPRMNVPPERPVDGGTRAAPRC